MSENNKKHEEIDYIAQRKKSQRKMIIHSLLFIFFLTWTIIALVEGFADSEISEVWYNIFMTSLLVTPIATCFFISFLMQDIGLLRKSIRKIKGIEPKDRNKYYNEPNSETISVLKSKSNHNYYYFLITTVIAIVFMFYYIVVYTNVDGIFKIVSDDSDTGLFTDLFAFLGYISLIFFVLLFIFFFEGRRQKRESESKQKPLSIFKSLGAKSKSIFSKQPEDENPEEIDSPDFEEDFELKWYIGLEKMFWGYNLIWLPCYVLGIPLKIFLPLYRSSSTIEISSLMHMFNFIFWGICLILLIVYLIEMIPVWKKIKSLEIKTEKD